VKGEYKLADSVLSSFPQQDLLSQANKFPKRVQVDHRRALRSVPLQVSVQSLLELKLTVLSTRLPVEQRYLLSRSLLVQLLEMALYRSRPLLIR
jgi:hypothetical protein